MNDIYSTDFESKMDIAFTSKAKDEGWGQFRRTDRVTERSCLATTRPVSKKATPETRSLPRETTTGQPHAAGEDRPT